MNKERNGFSQSEPKYPDTSHLDELEEDLGIAIDQTLLKGQRAALQRIQSERLGRSMCRPSSLSVESNKYQSMSCRSLPSTQSTRDDTIREHGRFVGRLPCERNTKETFLGPKSSTQSDLGRFAFRTLTMDKRATQQSSARLSLSPTQAADDRVGHLQSGRKVFIKGASRVYNDIAMGNAVIVHCPGCKTVLQVGRGTRNLFCSVCKLISPIEQGPGGTTPRFDDEIASNVQKQEYEVAQVRLQAKQAQK